MNPDEIRFFAGRYLAPLVPQLKRHDLAWAEPADEEFVCPVEFVAVPIGWIKCSLTITAPPTHLGRATHVLVGLRTLPLYCPAADVLDFGIKRGHGLRASLTIFRQRWAIGTGAGEQVATELAEAVEEQWETAVRKIGTPEGVAAEIGYEARNDLGRLETLAYSRLLSGDFDLAARSVDQILTNPNRSGSLTGRASQIKRAILSDPATATRFLVEWRRARLASEGLLELAAPQSSLEPVASTRATEPAGSA
jgi:hypothetical protein